MAITLETNLQAVLAEIYIYPVKSLAGIKVSNWQVNKKGLLHDRKWVLIDSKNRFLSQRHMPKMALIKTQLSDNKLILSTATSGTISLPLNPINGNDCTLEIWNQQCAAKTTQKEVNDWLSNFLAIECQLVYQPDEVIRSVDPKYALASDQINFPDGFPFLITSKASLDSLNQAMGLQLPMLRFRPNLVISQCHSYAEDSWRELTINQIDFRLPKPCSRCSIPTIDTETGETNKEPLSTLNRLRKWNKRVYFGQNALHSHTGTLATGNIVYITHTGAKQPPL